MIGSTRLLMILFAMLATVSSMGWLGGSGGQPRGCEGDWPEEFPQEPEGFQFKCKCPCKCKPKPTTLKSSTTSNSPTSVVPSSTTERTTQSTSASSSTPTSTLMPSSTRTTPTSTFSSSSSSTATTLSIAEPTPNPQEPEVDNASGSGIILEGDHIPVANDESAGGDLVEEGTGTTFWIRSPTPPNNPESVMKGGVAFTVGPPQFATIKIDAPYVPDLALTPSGVQSGDLDFAFKTVGTPKAPRKVIDPDA